MSENANLAKAAAWMAGTIVSFSAMAVAGREVSAAHDTFEIMTYRSVVGFLIVCLCLTLFGGWQQVTAQRLPTHVLRNVFHFTGQNLWFYAIAIAPLAQVFALEFTSPLWAMVLAPFLLNDHISKRQALAGVVGFLGILVVTRPGFATINLGVPFAAASAVLFALTNIFTKRLTQKEQIGSILFWLTGIQLVFGMVTVIYDGQVAWPTADTAPWLIVIGICGLSAHFCLTTALSLAPVTFVMPIDFIRLPAIAIVGMLLYAEATDLWVFVGAGIIFFGNYLNLSARKPQKT